MKVDEAECKEETEESNADVEEKEGEPTDVEEQAPVEDTVQNGEAQEEEEGECLRCWLNVEVCFN